MEGRASPGGIKNRHYAKHFTAAAAAAAADDDDDE